MLYLQVPYKKYLLRAMIKNRGGIWNSYLKMWELDKKPEYIPRKLKRYIKFDDTDIESYSNEISKQSKPNSVYETLSVREVNFLQAYMKHKGDAGEAAVDLGCPRERGAQMIKRVFAKPVAQRWIAGEVEKMSEEARWGFEEKLITLKQIAQVAAPINAKSITEMAPQHAISAIAEANKMQGHYSADKRVNINVEVDQDIERVKRLTAELLEKNKKEY